MIRVTYKETPKSCEILNEGTSIHREDAGLLIDKVWLVSKQLNDTRGFTEVDNGENYTVSAEAEVWREAIDKYSSQIGSSFVDAFLKKSLGFALPAANH